MGIGEGRVRGVRVGEGRQVRWKEGGGGGGGERLHSPN